MARRPSFPVVPVTATFNAAAAAAVKANNNNHHTAAFIYENVASDIWRDVLTHTKKEPWCD